MPDKEVIIAGKRMMYGTNIKCSPETNNSTTNTFDGNIVQGTKNVAYSIDLGRVRYDSQVTHRELSEKVEDMMETPDIITVREIIRPSGESPYCIVDNYFDCITDGNDYEIKTDDHTVENLKFKASRRERKYENV